MSVIFHASSVGKLLVGGNSITPRQLERLRELESRKRDPDAKDLTSKMEQELADLTAKADAPYEFGATAKTYIRECWLKNTFGYEEPIVTTMMLKGIKCEDDSLGVLSRQVPGGFRVKNEERWENDYFTGEPDTFTSDDEWVEDVKTSWTIKTFMEVHKPDPIYFAQGQAYMDLTGRSKFRLAHVLVETPPEIIEEEKKSFYFKFNCDESDPNYLKAIAKVDAMHGASNLIPEEKRIKVFEFQKDESYLSTLKTRVEQARRYYNALTI
jgi:hypothetical protein